MKQRDYQYWFRRIRDTETKKLPQYLSLHFQIYAMILNELDRRIRLDAHKVVKLEERVKRMSK